MVLSILLAYTQTSPVGRYKALPGGGFQRFRELRETARWTKKQAAKIGRFSNSDAGQVVYQTTCVFTGTKGKRNPPDGVRGRFYLISVFSPLSVCSKLSQNDDFLSILAELYEQRIQRNYIIDMASMLGFGHSKRCH